MTELALDEPQAIAGSYRDPGGRVYRYGERILRTVMDRAAADYEFVRSTGLLQELAADGQVVAATPVDRAILGPAGRDARHVIEHPRVPFVSYPYEWCFSALKSAALLHLDLHLKALERGVTLSDASAYNIQFLGGQPIFIDHLSFRRYRDGEVWAGHRQFCEQFLNPLLLNATLGVAHNAWYRGSPEGIPIADLNRVLRPKHKMSWRVLTHVVLQDMLQGRAGRHDDRRTERVVKGRKLPLPGLQAMLRGLSRWIERLRPRDAENSAWAGYADGHGYSDPEVAAKRGFVAEFASAVRPRQIWDLGCNSGDYAKVALDAGAGYAVGFDFDQGALERGFARARAEDLAFLPLFLDVANPSPSQGWAETERPGLRGRAGPQAILALALVHHLAIGRNIPLDGIADWLVDLAPAGIVEFVPKDDPMVVGMLRLRDDIFDAYSAERFADALLPRARIVEERIVSKSGRRLIWFERR